MTAGSFEWDDDKEAANLEKHGISFGEASFVFEGPALTWTDRRFDYGEEWCITIGMIRSIVAVVVVHTRRNGRVRIISARLANRRERRLYDDHFR